MHLNFQKVCNFLLQFREKIKRNVERDLDNTITLRDNGWIVLRFWETDIKKHLDECVAEVLRQIELRKNTTPGGTPWKNQ